MQPAHMFNLCAVEGIWILFCIIVFAFAWGRSTCCMTCFHQAARQFGLCSSGDLLEAGPASLLTRPPPVPQGDCKRFPHLSLTSITCFIQSRMTDTLQGIRFRMIYSQASCSNCPTSGLQRATPKPQLANIKVVLDRLYKRFDW